jgi:hypothetical protein
MSCLSEAGLIVCKRIDWQAANNIGAALTTIRDTLPERNDAYARLVFAVAAEALEPEGQPQ